MSAHRDTRPLLRVYDRQVRLESQRPSGSLERGLRAEVHDAAWFLGRQWQMGELQGENASTPTRVRARVRHIPIEGDSDAPEHDPKVTPAEVIIETEADDWWTMSRRVMIGRRLAERLNALGVAETKKYLIQDFPPPYDRLNGKGLDGLLLWQDAEKLGLRPEDVPDMPAHRDAWRYDRLHYSDRFSAGGTVLQVPQHDGGSVDWYSIDAEGAAPAGGEVTTVDVYPGRFSFPGAPNPRYWEIEGSDVTFAGIVPDRSSFATLLALEMIMRQSDNWFTFPISARSGHLAVIEDVEITDSFGDTYTVAADPDWEVYRVAGLSADTIAIWPRAVSPMRGEVIEDVLLAVDEDANRLWAVEMMVGMRSTDARREDPESKAARRAAAKGEGMTTLKGQQSYLFRPSSHLPLHWHPYEPVEIGGKRMYVQGRLADLSRSGADGLLPEATAGLLQDPAAPQKGPVHTIDPVAVPRTGLKLERRWMSARRADGLPVIWQQKRRLPLMSPPVSGLRFDVSEPVVGSLED
ncbi:MAG: hypothetical protein AAF092_04445 [Pseudomonadota bacterium]